MNETPIIFFVGKPGSGKTTQAKLLSDKMDWIVHTSGESFREIAKENTPVGRKVKESTEAGLLMPSWFASFVYLRSFLSLPDTTGAIFDGAGRTAPEGKIILESLTWLNRPYFIFCIDVSDEIVRERLAKRAISSGRADDHAIDIRLQEFHTQSEEAIDVLQNSPAYVLLNGEQEPAIVAKEILKHLSLS